MSPKYAVAFGALLAATGARAQQVAPTGPTSVPQVAATLPGTANPPAADPTTYPPRLVNGVPKMVEFDFGTRFAESTGRNAFTLRGDKSYPYPVSRLSYQDDASSGLEVYGRVEHVPTGLFLKYYAGFGLSDGQGKLRDQDFEPVTSPYSSTISRVKDGSLAYGTVDVGYHVFHQAVLDLGPFVGYQYLGEKDVSYGCTQRAANPDVCSPGQVASDMKAVGDSENWEGVRVGLEGRLRLPYRLTLVGEGAYLPYVVMNGSDTHYQRLGTDFATSTPLRVKGDGYQVEGRVEYEFTSIFKVSAGARYTQLAGDGSFRFDKSYIPVGYSNAQGLHYETERLTGYLGLGVSF